MELTLSEAQNGAQLAVYMADIVVVRLREDPGGGSRWALSPVDANSLETIDQRYDAAHAEGGGASVWKFRPRRPGRARLELTRRRAGEAAERFVVDLELR